MGRHFLLEYAALLIVASIVTSQDATVTYITPNHGGKNGATKLSVFGTNFDTNLDLGSTTPNKEVFFVSALNEYTCEVHEAESDERQTVCYTGAMETGTYYVRMKMDGVWLDRSQYCSGSYTNWKCRFTVEDRWTPILSQLSWVTNEPQQFLTASGRLYTNLISANVAAATNGKTATIRRVWMTSGPCSLYGEDQEPYEVILNGDEGTSDWGTLKCLVKDSYVGNQNISFIVDQDYGRSWPYSSVKRVSADNRIYMVQTYAVVTDISPKQGSTEGGTMMTISGRYFDNLSGITARVLVGGEECLVRSVSDHEITCLTPPQQEARSVYTGGRGMAVRIYPGITSFDEVLDDYTTEVPQFRDHTFPDFHGWSSYYTTQSDGFFIPNTNAKHKFIIKADDLFQFYFNSEGPDKNAAVMVAYSSEPLAEVHTDLFELTAGTECYFRVRHVQMAPVGQFVKIGVYVSDTNYTPDQTDSSVTEHQRITISSTVARETQTISFMNWTKLEEVESSWNFAMLCNEPGEACPGVNFYFSLFGINSEPVSFNSMSASIVQLALNNLIPLHGDKVEVTEGDSGYEITFKSHRGSFPLKAVSSDESKLTITMTETTAGSPKLDTFTFKVNGQVSAPVQYDAPAADVASAVLSLFGPTCPEGVQSGVGKAKYYFDMETISSSTKSGKRTAEQSFCGSYSVKNIGYIFMDDTKPYKPSAAKHVCFAYSGDISDRLSVTYTYITDSEKGFVLKRENLRHFWSVGLSNSFDEWNYFCYDLYDRLVRDHPGGSDFNIFRVLLNAGSDADTQLYVDNIFIGTAPLSSSEIESELHRMIPSAVPHIKLESVNVIKKSADEYEATFYPIECGHNFPLLGFAFASSTTALSSDRSKFFFGDGAQQIHVERDVDASSPVEGTFGISFPESSFSSIHGLPANATEEELKNALETLRQITNVYVTSSGTCYGYAWDVYFKSPGGDYPAMVGDASSLTSSPGFASISVTVETEGGLVMNPIYGDFIRTAHSTPQVQVFINNVPSHCEGSFDNDAATSCGYEWNDEATPKVTGISPTSASKGNEITITGSGFSTANENNNVSFGGVACIVMSSSESSITCNLGSSPAGESSLSINVAGKGIAKIFSETLEVVGQITSFFPSGGSVHGCTTITIAGSGFDDSSFVSIDGHACTVTSVSYASITCVTSAGSVGSFALDVTTSSSRSSSTSTFEYSSEGSVNISSVDQTILSVGGGETLTITGSGFGSVAGEVYFISGDARHSSEVTAWSDSEITIRTPSLPHGSYEVRAHVIGVGCSSSQSISYSFTVADVTPLIGSLVGGTSVTITGSGLTEDTSVEFGDVICDGVEVDGDGTTLTCVTSSTSFEHLITNSAQHPTFGVGYAWSPSTLDVTPGDHVTWAWSIPDQVTADVNIGLFTTFDSSSKEYDNDGFQVEAETSGRHTFAINKPGTLNYGSGCVDGDDVCSLFMRGTINCVKASTVSGDLSVTLGEQKARYSDDYTFTFDASLTPMVRSMEPRYGTTDDNIEIKGTGFNGIPTVNVGGKPCVVSESSTTSITCKVVPTAELSVGVYNEVLVNIEGQGNAINEIRNVIKRTFVVRPLIMSISPDNGSLAGGTRLTVEGSGFCTPEEIDCQPVVSIGDLNNCDVVEHYYNTIACVTKSSPREVTGEVKVTIGSNCQFNYAEASTPIVTSWREIGNHGNLSLEFEGRGFGTSADDVMVTLTSGYVIKSCDVTSATNVKVECNIGMFAVGSNKMLLSVIGKGFVQFQIASILNSPADIYEVLPSSGSTNGGTRITINGNGFVEGDTTVVVGGVACEVSTTSLSNVQCTTGPHSAAVVQVVITSNSLAYSSYNFEYSPDRTPRVDAINPMEGSSGDSLTILGRGFRNVSEAVTVLVGGTSCTVTSSKDDEVVCTLGERQGGKGAVEVHIADKGFAAVTTTFKYRLRAQGIAPNEGSFGGGQSVVITGQGFSENSLVTICNNTCIVTSYAVTEITCTAPANDNLSEETTYCDVVVANGNDDASSTSGYTYRSSLTPIIASVSPKRGGTGGGTEVTITGSGFGTDPQVSIDGSTCVISSSSDTSIICTTNAHQGSVKTKVRVEVGTNGIAQQENADFYYIDRWSSVFTWGGTSLPTTQDFVIIQEGQTVLLDTDTAVLTMLLIDGGELIFDEADVQLNAENILIVNGGLLQVGTEDAPFQHKAVIQMYGQLRSPELPIYGAKTLGVRNGTLDLHGRHVMHTWTKLAFTAEVGATQIMLEASVDWQIDDDIVIASTGLRHSQSENEQRTITAISEDGYTLTLNEALLYKHLGVTGRYGGKDIEFRAEVGLLTRNVVFKGTNDLAWNDVIPACEDGFDTGMFATQTCFQGRIGEETGSDEFGASIMMHSQEPSSGDVMARIENIEVTYAGQAFRMGRYPIHWHLMGDVSGMYVKSCSIHRTFNRAVTIHGTHNLLVENNVVYNIMGGAIFIEDGIETGNIIQYNLAVFVRQSTSLLNDDVTPAGYWVTNPNNTVRHNHAAGGTHFGFWYRMHEHPDGPSFDPNICQQQVELGIFENNTVHSQGWFGLWIFQTYKPMLRSSCDSTIPSPAKFRTLTTWNSEKGAEWVNCGAIQFIDFVVVNNEDCGMDVKLISGTQWGEGGAMIIDALVVGHVAELEIASMHPVGIVLPFAPGLYVKNVHFVNYNHEGVAFQGTEISGTCTFGCGGYYYWLEGLKFTDVNRKIRWRWPHEGVLLDRDGSFTGQVASTTVSPFNDLMDPSLCTMVSGEELSSNTDVPSAICSPGTRLHRIALNNPFPSSLEGNNIWVSNEHGNSSSSYLKERLTHKPGWMLLLPSKQSYRMWFEDGEQFTNITYNSRYYDFYEDDYIFVSHVFNQRPDVIKINGEERYSVANATALTPDSDNLDWYFNQESLEFQFIVSGKTSSSRRKRATLEVVDDRYTHVAVSPSIYRCIYAGCTPPADLDEIPPGRERPDKYELWSQNGPCMEWQGENNVIIKQTAVANEETIDCWVVVDVDSIDVDNITVQGVLQFESSCVVSAIYVLVQRGRIIAGFTDDDYFAGKLTINLRGDHDTPGWSLAGVDLGSKAIGCFGGCDFHGKPHKVYWTHLATTANAGSKVITLVKEVDWEAEDEIVVTTTGYRSDETEKHVITAISGDGRTITLSQPLEYRHMGEDYTVGDWLYSMRAEVGLLTRNIKIVGESYSNIDAQAFGARVLVGLLQVTGEEVGIGWARFSNVEFHQTGQEGWTEEWDPRFSLAWLNTGRSTTGRPSCVTGCAFHDGYSTAIGTFGADNVNITDNVVHRAVHDGIRLSGSNHRLERNLVTVALFRGTYGDRFEETNFKDWHASFEITETRNLIMNGNTAAGSERLGFHFDGEPCDASDEDAWIGNVAHGCLHGLHIFIDDGNGGCSMIRNFVVYKSWDFGIYHQTQDSVIIRNTIVVDSTVGYLPVIFAPPALSHRYEDKPAIVENMLCVGRSDLFDTSQDFMDEENDDNLKVRAVSPSKKAPSSPSGGKVCVLLPLFQSSTNSAPFKSFHGNLNYPTVHGLLNITGLHAHSYKQHHDNSRDLVFFTNPSNEDAYHPTILRDTTLSDVEEQSKVFFERPSLGLVNPSDCVDMECDGRKKCLIKDLDGGFLGSRGAVVPQAEFGWDDPNEIARGLGDYRIPKTMLTATDGTRIPVEDIADWKGIIRSPACEYKSSWLAYDCHGEDALDYQMLVIESMDEDTETRRLSPVALLGGRYIDLNNGPQDHGWCAGYTCQKRISTFYTIVASGHHFDIFFTGYAPRNLRLHLLNVDDSVTMRVAIWYGRPERLDVLRVESGIYIHPQNSVYDEEKEYWTLRAPDQANEGEFKPAIDSAIHGANYMDRRTNLLYVTLRGREPIDIVTVPAVVIKFGFPATTVDDFFGEKLVENLANLLKVPPSKIRVVDIVRETNARRKRDATEEVVTYTILYSDPIRNETAHNNTDYDATILNNGTTQIVEAYQTGTLSSDLGVEVASMQIRQASETSVNTTDESKNSTDEVFTIPTSMNITSISSIAEEFMAFAKQPVITLLDNKGEVVNTLDNMFEVTISLNTTEHGADANSRLNGRTSVVFTKGKARFTGLMITHSGSYSLQFQITKPISSSISSATYPIAVLMRTVMPTYLGRADTYAIHGSDILINIQLLDSKKQPLENIGFKGHTWKAAVSLDHPTMYAPAALAPSATTTFTFDPFTATATTSNLQLANTQSFYKYNLVFRVYTEPALYEFTLDALPIPFHSPNQSTAAPTNVLDKITIEVVGRPFLQRRLTSEPMFLTLMNNFVVGAISNTSARVSNMTTREASNENTNVFFYLSADKANDLTDAKCALKEALKNDSSILAEHGINVAITSCWFVVNDSVCYDVTVATPGPDAVPEGLETWVYVVIGVVAAILVIAVFVFGTSCALKREQRNKVAGGEYLGSNSSASSSFAGERHSMTTAFTSSSWTRKGKRSSRATGLAPVQM